MVPGGDSGRLMGKNECNDDSAGGIWGIRRQSSSSINEVHKIICILVCPGAQLLDLLKLVHSDEQVRLLAARVPRELFRW